jgi:hypothetical protein
MTKDSDKFLAGFAVEEAKSLSLTAAWAIAGEIVETLPQSKPPAEIQQPDSSTTTEMWKRGAADWQRPPWK